MADDPPARPAPFAELMEEALRRMAERQLEAEGRFLATGIGERATPWPLSLGAMTATAGGREPPPAPEPLAEKMRGWGALLRAAAPPWAGLPVHVSHHCLKETAERLFPASKHRSRRIRKKLVRRFGGEFRKAPAAFMAPDGLHIHPALHAEALAALAGKGSDG